MTTEKHDYLAIIRIGAGSSFGRSENKEAAIGFAIKSLKDWSRYYDVADKEVTVNVVDVAGYSDCDWGDYHDYWLQGTNEETGQREPIRREVDRIKRRTPKWKVGK